MAIKIAAWNVEGRLTGDVQTGRGTATHILKSIEALDADVIVLLEAFMDDAPAEGVLESLRGLGYEVLRAAYDDRDRMKNKFFHGEMYSCILSRLPISDVAYIRPAGIRNLIACSVVDPVNGQKLRVIGTHLEDRSEVLRIIQVKGLVEYVNNSNTPIAVLGDFNAMWCEGPAHFLDARLTRYIAKHIPHKIFRGVVMRVVDMAAGTALNLLVKKTHLREVDQSHKPTATPKRYGALWMPSIRLIQIDHMFVSPGIIASDFMIGKDGGSDHRAIFATLSI